MVLILSFPRECSTGSRTGSLLLPPPAPYPEGEKLHPSCTPHPVPPQPALWGHTCLLEDMLVSVLMLLVSVTTMAEGKREVWEYWGGSCLCAYTADRRGQVRGKPPRGGSSRDGNGQQGDKEEIKQGENPPLPSQPLHSQSAARSQKPQWGLRGCGWTRWMEWGKEGMRQDVTTLHR